MQPTPILASPLLSRLSFLAAVAVACSCAGATPANGTLATAEEPVSAGAVSPAENPFLHAVGTGLVDGDGRQIRLKGMSFGNGVYANPPLPEWRRSEADYRRCQELGVNSVRFYLHHQWLEGRNRGTWNERGFAWLEQNVAWARAHGIGLILNLHVPPGGFQSNGGGRALWTSDENQRRLVALWREIARRFANEPAIQGYDLLNEPVVTESIGQWERLARRTVAAIREVDRRHLVVVERVNAVCAGGFLRAPRAADWAPDRNGLLNFFRIDDGNVMYEFHYYQPFGFTHQGATWTPVPVPSTASYPGSFTDWDGLVKQFDPTYHERMLARVLEVQGTLGAPMYMGEFGVIRAGFAEGRNGAGWLKDVAELVLGAGIGVNYHSYDADDPFGTSGTAAAEDALAAAYRGG